MSEFQDAMAEADAQGFETNGSGPSEKSLTPDLANIILAKEYFAVDAGRKLYYFKDGHYIRDGEGRVKLLVKRILSQSNLAHKWTSRRANEVIEYITVDSQKLWERPPLNFFEP